MLLLGLVGFVVVAAGYAVLYRRTRRRRVGTASVGTMFDLLSEDRRKAVEIVVEEKASATDPESVDGKDT